MIRNYLAAAGISEFVAILFAAMMIFGIPVYDDAEMIAGAMIWAILGILYVSSRILTRWRRGVREEIEARKNTEIVLPSDIAYRMAGKVGQEPTGNQLAVVSARCSHCGGTDIKFSRVDVGHEGEIDV